MSQSREAIREEQRAELMSLSTSDAIFALVVGDKDNKFRFTLSRETACYRSPVLYAALKGEFKESESLEYRMAHVNQATGKLLVQWLRYGTFEVIQLAAGFDMRGNEAMAAAAEEEDCNLVALWAVGDELNLPSLQNATLSKLHKIQRDNGLIRDRALERLYELTAEGSMLRKYIVVYAVQQMTPSIIKTRSSPGNSLCHEFLTEFALWMSTWIQAGNPEQLEVDAIDYFVVE